MIDVDTTLEETLDHIQRLAALIRDDLVAGIMISPLPVITDLVNAAAVPLERAAIRMHINSDD